jgi:cytoskeleton protein RodZ
VLLPVKIVAALEEGHHAELPAPAYIKGYIRAYAGWLGLDEKPLIDSYLAMGVRDPELSVSSPVKDGSPNRLSVALSVGVIALVSGVLSALWWNHQEFSYFDMAVIDEPAPAAARRAATDQRPSDSQPVAVNPVSVNPIAVNNRPKQPPRLHTWPASKATARIDKRPSADGAIAEDRSPTVTIAAATPSSDISGVEKSAPVEQTQDGDSLEPERIAGVTAIDNDPALAGATRASQAPRPSPAAPAQDMLRLNYGNESWTEIQDANDLRLLYGLVAAGTTRSIAGTAPFRVFLDSSRAVQVTINGQPFDQSPFVRDNDTARFTVDKPITDRTSE